VSDPCPVCKKTILWYGEGERPPGPCPRCLMTMPSVRTTKVENFMEAASHTGGVIVMRRNTVLAVLEDDHVVQRPAWSLAWRAPAETEEGWRMFNYAEQLLLDDYGNVAKDGSVWERVHADNLRITFDTSWTGAF